MQELEKMVHVSTGYLSKFVSHHREIGVYKAYEISKILGCTIEDLFEKDMWKEIKIKELEAELKALKGGDNSAVVSASD